jgi:8-amino-7-oxononanoate synthase
MGPAHPGAGWGSWVEDRLAAVRAAGRWRSPRTFDGRPVVTFASNDYLGLTGHPAVVEAAASAARRWGSGSGASRLVVGSRPVHDDLEAAIADWKRAGRAVVFPTGYAANLSVLTALGGPEVVVCSDELNHASIIDGCRLSRSRVEVYGHGDVDRLDGLLAAAAAAGRRALVVTDAVFSMDGDEAPVADLLACCRRHGALLVLDEAHSVPGPDVPADAVADGTVIRVGTLSKALGSLGGFVAGTAAVADLLVNTARPYIFTTAPTPADAAAALAALGVLRSPEGSALLARLRSNVERVRPGHPSPIVPVVVGDEATAVAAAAALLERGLHIPAIRPPTVPAGTSRLRVAISAEHTADMIDDLVAALADVVGGGGRAA